MWIRKSDLEIKQFDERQERKRKSIVRPMFYGLLWGSLFVLVYYLGFRGGTRGYYAIARPGRFDATTLSMGILFFGFAFGLVYRKQLRREKFLGNNDETLLCNGCWKPSSNGYCECGGKLEPYEYFAWKEDEDSLGFENNRATEGAAVI